jgi:hypothetical protein
VANLFFNILKLLKKNDLCHSLTTTTKKRKEKISIFLKIIFLKFKLGYGGMLFFLFITRAKVAKRKVTEKSRKNKKKGFSIFF